MLLTFNFWGQALFGLLVTGIGLTYLSWRTWQLYLIREPHPIPYLFLSLEIMMYLSSVIWFVDMLYTTNFRRPAHILPVDNHKDWPTVDVLIPCCKEPTDLVKETILAALWQDYPTEKFTVYVCDDGGDEELKSWVESEQAVNGTNVRYIRRVKTPGIPHHAKAGNVNHAMTLTTSEYVGILDADMLVQPEYLRRMLAQFASPRIAFVQCPQAYYNVPEGDPLGQQCSFFYDIIMPHRDTRNSAPSVGTGVIFRRKALEEIGGISTGTLTEDFDTSLRMHSQGWHTVYISDKLQYGLVPTDLRSALRQRERWAIGTLEILAKRNPLFARGLTWDQRIMYFSCGLSYIIPLGIVLFIIIPLLTLIWDWPIMPVTTGNAQTLVYLLVPYLFCTRLVIYVMYWNVPNSLTARNRDFQLFLWMAPFLCVALGKFLMSGIKATSFKVTNAAKKSKSKWFDLSGFAGDLLYCWFHILYVVFGLFVMVYRGLRWNPKDCSNTFQFVSQIMYVILNAQAMLAPVLYVLTHDPEAEDRRERLTYTNFGIPVIDPVKVAPKNGRWVWLLEVTPLLWGLFYLGIFLGFLSGYDFGCSLYFAGTLPEINVQEWNKFTSL
jgi:cellulose synthase/poly-beta-1,6-N-acetylglucosamine synthase-like glycosyltransferase